MSPDPLGPPDTPDKHDSVGVDKLVSETGLKLDDWTSADELFLLEPTLELVIISLSIEGLSSSGVFGESMGGGEV